MKKFHVSIIMKMTDPEIVEKGQPEENRIVGSWRGEGFVSIVYFRADGSGLFAIMNAISEDYILDQLKLLPFHPYQVVNIVELRMEEKTGKS